MFSLIKKHSSVLLLAILLGFLTFYPQIIAINGSDNFNGVYPTNNDDEIYYLTRGQEVLDGHSNLSNSYLWEHKTGPPLQFWVPDYIAAKGASLLGFGLVEGYITYDFVFPLILVLLGYLILYRVTKSTTLSLASSIFLYLGIFLSLFGRPVSPQLTFVFFLTLFLFLINYLRSKRNLWLVLAALNLGFLFYIYTYYWTYFFVLIPVFLVLALLLLRDRTDFRKWGALIMGALVLGVPYYIQTIKSVSLSSYGDTIARVGMLNTHFPSGLTIIFWSIIITLVFLVLYKRNVIKSNPLNVFLLSAVISTAVVTNQHIITGKNLEFSSHYLPLSVFVFVFSSAYLIGQLIKLKPRIEKGVLFTILVLVLIFSVPRASALLSSQQQLSEGEVHRQRYGEIFEWLKNNTKKDSVVYANQELSSLIPAYTHNNVFYAREANLYFLSNEEVKKRFIINNYFEDVDKEFLLKNERSIWGTEYINKRGHFGQQNKIRKILGIAPKALPAVPDEEIENMLTLDKEIKEKSLKENLDVYRADYFIRDLSVNIDWDFSTKELLFSSSNIEIYGNN